ncbi:Calcium/calmodulin-dependent protein kinase, partial [Rasamsonia emersonii CBS 393.64]
MIAQQSGLHLQENEKAGNVAVKDILWDRGQSRAPQLYLPVPLTSSRLRPRSPPSLPLQNFLWQRSSPSLSAFIDARCAALAPLWSGWTPFAPLLRPPFSTGHPRPRESIRPDSLLPRRKIHSSFIDFLFGVVSGQSLSGIITTFIDTCLQSFPSRLTNLAVVTHWTSTASLGAPVAPFRLTALSACATVLDYSKTRRSPRLEDQNLKNFIRHGKQARLVTPHAEPTTDVTAVHAQQQRQPQGQYTNNLDAIDNRHGNNQPAAQKAPESHTKPHTTKVSRADIERLVAEEKQSKAKMPKYPGLERWTLLEKMGDGAFSNVYRARDNTGQMGEVAIKVVRKYEMNSNQRANILKEVQIMRQLDHPNIVKLLDFSESRQYYYIILELCPGGELFHQIVRLTYFSEDLS